MRQRNTLVAVALLLVLSMIAMVTASYAWLSVSRIPFISDVSVSVMTENALLIAPDDDGAPGERGLVLDASAFLSDMVPLKPVTYTPEAFCKIIYDETGRTNGVEPLSEENFNVRYPEEDRTSPDAREAEARGYMVAYPFWMKTDGTPADVFLVDATQTADGQMGKGTYVVGAPVWNDGTVSHDNGGRGSESTLRIGFACTPTNNAGEPTGETTFIMYEPNADRNADGTEGYLETQSINGGPLIDYEHLILQNASTWEEQTPVLQDAVIYTVGNFVNNPQLFHLERSGMMHVTMYIWMEGQDPDCISRYVSRGASILAHFQFGVSAEEQNTGIVRPSHRP